MRLSLAACLVLLSSTAFAEPPAIARDVIKHGFSAAALKGYDRVTSTAERGRVTNTDTMWGKDTFQSMWAFRGTTPKRTDSATLHKGQLSEIAVVNGKRAGVETQYVRNYRERPLLGKLLRIESTVSYKATMGDGTHATLLGEKKRLALGPIKIPLPGDGKAIVSQVR